MYKSKAFFLLSFFLSSYDFVVGAEQRFVGRWVRDDFGNYFPISSHSFFVDQDEQKTVVFDRSAKDFEKHIFTYNLMGCTALAYITESSLRRTVTMSHFSPSYDFRSRTADPELAEIGWGLYHQRYVLDKAIEQDHCDSDIVRKKLLVIVPAVYEKIDGAWQFKALKQREIDHVQQLEQLTRASVQVVPYNAIYQSVKESKDPRFFYVRCHAAGVSWSHFQDGKIVHNLHE